MHPVLERSPGTPTHQSPAAVSLQATGPGAFGFNGRRTMRARSRVFAGLLVPAVFLVCGSAVLGQATPVSGPLAQYSTYLVATHYLRGQPYETHHYFKPLREGVLQGLVFREPAGGAGLIEVEWAISEQVYNALPDWQKEFWHPLAPAVDAGRIKLPELAAAQQQEMLKTIRGLYAQTFNLSGIESGTLPVGLEGVAMVTHITRAEMLRALHRP